jgi:hypothetical protein
MLPEAVTELAGARKGTHAGKQCRALSDSADRGGSHRDLLAGDPAGRHELVLGRDKIVPVWPSSRRGRSTWRAGAAMPEVWFRVGKARQTLARRSRRAGSSHKGPRLQGRSTSCATHSTSSALTAASKRTCRQRRTLPS